MAVVAPVALMGFAEISGRRWARTTVAGVYSAYAMFMLWLFPFFPATPKLGPVYQKITHMVPMEFPLLIIVPALLLDALGPKLLAWNKWPQAALAGPALPAGLPRRPMALCRVSWSPPASANWFFGTKYFAYFASPNGYDVRHLFVPADGTAAGFWIVMLEAAVAAILSTRLGLAWGGWVRKIRR